MQMVKELTMNSREVAPMMEKRHADLLRDIETHIGYLSQNAKLRSDDFFLVSQYKSGTGKKYKCYLITKKGCEFLAHKLTGKKGAIFTATYINKFHEMGNHLKNPQPTQLAMKPSLVRKTYQGIPVMTFDDLGILSDLTKDLAYYRVKQLEVPYRVLLGKELFAFKRENEGYGTVNAIAILYREEVLLFCRALGLDVDLVCRYFEQESTPKFPEPKKEEKPKYPTEDDYRKAELMLKACEHITDKGFANYMAEGALYLLTGELYHKEYEMAKLKAQLRQTLRGMNKK